MPLLSVSRAPNGCHGLSLKDQAVSTFPIRPGWRMLLRRMFRTSLRKAAGRSKPQAFRACRTICTASFRPIARKEPRPVCRRACLESGMRSKPRCSKLHIRCGTPCKSPSFPSGQHHVVLLRPDASVSMIPCRRPACGFQMKGRSDQNGGRLFGRKCRTLDMADAGFVTSSPAGIH